MSLLFVVNPRSGTQQIDHELQIRNFCNASGQRFEIIRLDENCNKEKVLRKAEETGAGLIVAVGGDGTVKFVADCVLQSKLTMAIIPGGSANGMARELKIPLDMNDALGLLQNGREFTIHAVRVNKELCIHLADIGFNAFTVKKFEAAESRGMWGYIKAAWKVLWRNPHMKVYIQTDGQLIYREAAMLVIANATQYGTGVVINPEGQLSDRLFEVVIVKKISITELFKMRVTQQPFDPAKTEVFQTSSLEVDSLRKVHFQVDGEYLGKLNRIEAMIIPEAVKVLVPADVL